MWHLGLRADSWFLPALRYRRADQKHKQGDRLAAERVFPTVNGKLKRSACCRNPEDNNGRGGFIERRYCLQCWILMYDFGIACMFCRVFYQLNNIYTTSFTRSRFIYITLSLSLSLSSLFLSLSLYTIYIYIYIVSPKIVHFVSVRTSSKLHHCITFW